MGYFVPLFIPFQETNEKVKTEMEGQEGTVLHSPCIMCDKTFSSTHLALEHLGGEHHLIIADAEKIADLRG